MAAIPLLTANELASILRITEDLVKRLTVREDWPHVRFSGKTIRYREEHVEMILAKYESGHPITVPAASRFEQTARSKARR